MEQLRIRLKTGPPTPHYSAAFKKQIVREFGRLRKEEIPSSLSKFSTTVETWGFKKNETTIHLDIVSKNKGTSCLVIIHISKSYSN
jgi:hypothetical protein